jgi:hypothetical protein
MNKYFFDRVSREGSEYDYRGREFHTPETAHQMAELIALDLEVVEEGIWSGWAINVYSADGQQFFSVPIPELDLVAA